MKKLLGKVALVTGGTRNVGKGIAIGLAEAGATVYVTGRTIKDKDVQKANDAGGKVYAVVCDHLNDADVKDVFKMIIDKEGHLDILVNNAWGGYLRLRNRSQYRGFKWKEFFWKQPLELYDEMHDVGVRSNYVASVFASNIMTLQKSGLIVNISFYASKKYYGNVAYGVAKAAVDKMTFDMAEELKSFRVSCVSLYPGYIDDYKKVPNNKKESSIFVGRSIAAIAGDSNILEHTGKVLVTAELGKKYGFKDIDGTFPIPYDAF